MKIARILLIGIVVASSSACNAIPVVPGNDAAFRKRVEADPFPTKGEGGRWKAESGS